jgi:hypothetical protein
MTIHILLCPMNFKLFYQLLRQGVGAPCARYQV